MADGLPPFYGPGPFSPDQWTNPYSLYMNRQLPWPSSYVGWPTDASGNRIQAQPGMTLNSQPAIPNPANQAAQQPQGPNPLLSQGNAAQNLALSQFEPNLGLNTPGLGIGAQMAMLQPQMMTSSPAGGQGPGRPAQPLDASSYLALLANPGRVTTPGATVPGAGGVQPGPGVLQQFLANWRPAMSGPGSGFAQAFAQNFGMNPNRVRTSAGVEGSTTGNAPSPW